MKKFTILFVMLFIATLSIDAQKFNFDNNWGKSGLNLVDSRSNAIQLIYSVPEFTMEDVQVDGQVMKNITLPGTFLGNDEGLPNLPGKGSFIAIPQGSTPKVRIVSQRTETLHNIEIAPAQRIPLDTEKDFPLVKNQSVYSKNAFYPESPVMISEVNQIRGVDAINLGITPFQYNPVTKDLIVYQDLKVEITFEGGTGQFGNDAFRSRWWDPIMQDNILNYSSLPAVDYDKRFQSYSKGQRDIECEYIIITPTGSDFLSWADSIANFRNQQGILTHIYTLTDVGGNTETAIEAFIDNAYNNWTIKPVACLLLGDYGTDATKNIISHMYTHPDGYPNFASDNKYADVTGDEMPDVVFARIVANNASQLQILCSRFLDYERNPPVDPLFYDKPITALGWQTVRWFQLCSEIVGGFWKNTMNKHPRRINAVYEGSQNIWSSATNTSQVTNYFGSTGLGYIPATPSELGGWTGGNATKINQAIDSGAFILMHRDHGYYDGWGEPAYSSSNVTALNNTLLPFVFSINCQTGAYHRSADCFGEKFVRQTKNGHNAGALGIVCPSEVSYSFVNDTYVWGMMDNMWPNFMPDKETQPGSRGVFPAFGNAAGKYFLKLSSWPYNTGNKQVTYRLFHMLGDGFSVVYFEVPQQLTVTHDEEIQAGATTFNIITNDSAFIALTVNNEIIATGYGSGATPVVITIPSQTAGTQVMVTVTKQNFFRYQDNVPVSYGPLITNFSANVTDLCPGTGVNFTDESAGSPTSWGWTFDGGTPGTATVKNPSNIVYSAPGDYSVKLVISRSANSDSTTKTAYIHVYHQPTADFTTSNASCIDQATIFSDLSNANGGTITDWLWDFGDGSAGATSQNPSHTYTSGDTFNVTLQVKNNGTCDNQVTEQVIVGQAPNPAAQPAGPAVVCPGSTGTPYTTPGAGYATSYAWEIAPAAAGTIDGTTTTATFNASATYSGPVSIVVKGLNDCGEGTPSPSYDVNISAPIVAPAKPEGADSVNIANVPTSEFTTTGVPSVTTYAWSITPEAAGTIAGTGLIGIVTWDLSFRGPSAVIVVKGTDTCGPGLPSLDKTVIVKNTLGISNSNEFGAEIYPNPNSGKFTIVLRGNGKNISIRILNTLGSLVYTEKNVMVTGMFTRNIDLSTLSEGVYFLKVETDVGTLVRKLVIRK
ncbi:MAG TPA: C25 family cysteine peptidase [Bacteroidales bacterium]|nr:C25 family cysteine peptidase [Bacteroidales bacterium]